MKHTAPSTDKIVNTADIFFLDMCSFGGKRVFYTYEIVLLRKCVTTDDKHHQL